MARSQRKKAAARGATSRGRAQGRSSTSRSRKKAAPATEEVEVVEEGAGMGIDDGIVIVTTVALLAACLLVDAYLGKYGDGGLLF